MCAQPNVRALSPDVDALHEQPDDARLFRREEFIPQWIKPLQSGANFDLTQVADLLSRLPPSHNDNFRRAEERANLIDHGCFDLTSGKATDRGNVGAAFNDRLAHVVAVELVAAPGVRR